MGKQQSNNTNPNASPGENGEQGENAPIESTAPAEGNEGTEAGEDPGQTGSDAQGDSQGGNSEAAKYRRQLRETQGERDTLRSQLTAMQTRDAERLATGTLQDGSDLWQAGVTLADLVSEDGTVSEETVAAKAGELAESKPHYARRVGTGTGGTGQGPRGTRPTKQPTFQDLLQSGR